jgi:hypothetical protein
VPAAGWRARGGRGAHAGGGGARGGQRRVRSGKAHAGRVMVARVPSTLGRKARARQEGAASGAGRRRRPTPREAYAWWDGEAHAERAGGGVRGARLQHKQILRLADPRVLLSPCPDRLVHAHLRSVPCTTRPNEPCTRSRTGALSAEEGKLKRCEREQWQRAHEARAWRRRATRARRRVDSAMRTHEAQSARGGGPRARVVRDEISRSHHVLIALKFRNFMLRALSGYRVGR